MKREEITVSRRSNSELARETFNSTDLTGVETGQKLQVSVRLEAKTIRLIEEIQEQSGCSFAESVRRIVRKGLKAHFNQNNSTKSISGGRE